MAGLGKEGGEFQGSSRHHSAGMLGGVSGSPRLISTMPRGTSLSDGCTPDRYTIYRHNKMTNITPNKNVQFLIKKTYDYYFAVLARPKKLASVPR